MLQSQSSLLKCFARNGMLMDPMIGWIMLWVCVTSCVTFVNCGVNLMFWYEDPRFYRTNRICIEEFREAS